MSQPAQRQSAGRSAAARYSRTLQEADPAEARNFLEKAAQLPDPTVPSVENLRAERAAEVAAATADNANNAIENVDVNGGGEPIRVRVTPVRRPKAVVVNAHASGWVRGLASWTDVVARALRDRFEIATVAPSYRLAPEHPHPAGRDDIVDTLRWAVESYAPEHGAGHVFVLGSSAGAHLSALALERVREFEPELFGHVSGAILSYGIYDLSKTPSMRNAPARTPVVSPVPQEQYMAWAFPDTDPEQRRGPALSPLFADLSAMPPALFSACERDPLRDDTLFMAARWADAGSDTDLDIWQDAVHSFDRHYPSTAQRYADRVGSWIGSRCS